ncbi:MAG TPA: S8 family serine peptidase [Cytophagaceae bacterium]|jgi:serine protease AprX|nr:S8 family serine peptidase [Cytophagaceae bacterium]
MLRAGRIVLASVFFLLFFYHSEAQQKKYLIYFTDKNNSPFTITNPGQFLSSRAIQRRTKQGISIKSRDLPVNQAYVDSIRNKGATVWYSSRWFNAAMVFADSAQYAAIIHLPFVQNSTQVRRLAASAQVDTQESIQLTNSIPGYGNSFNQLSMIGVDYMHALGFHGEGIQIAILDAGFSNANTLFFFDSLFTNKQILATWDFVDHEINVYDDHSHGTNVLSILGGYASGQLIGPAYKASYYLLRTEDAATEYPVEEVNWLIGAEYADSAGADIISSSLGYSTFDNPSMNHTYADLSGNTTIISRAADMAVSTGMIVVNSAGNEGANPWHYILAPADGDSVLAIGAVDASGNYAAFSSQGPSYDGRIKPDVAAQGQGVTIGTASNTISTGSGTSFSCPLISGMTAGLWQAFPALKNTEIIDYIKRSASHYAAPDTYTGYGIPNFRRASELIKLAGNSQVYLYPNPVYGMVNLVVPSQDIGKAVNIILYDLPGQLIYQEDITSSVQVNGLGLDTSHLSEGMYLMRVTIEGKIYTLKFIKG